MKTLRSLTSVPAPKALPESYDRFDPHPAEQAELLRRLDEHRDWARLSWQPLLEELIELGRTDIATSRLAEGHIDAVRILDEAGASRHPGAIYGVWASRSHATGVRASQAGSSFELDGTLRFASGAGIIDRALIPAWVDADTHYLVDIDVHDLPETTPAWTADAMAASRSATLLLKAVSVSSSVVIGTPNFYLERPGFFVGGVRVAAVWAGGAARLLDLCLAQLRAAPRSPSREQRLGQMRTDVAAAVSLVRFAGLRLDETDPLHKPADESQRILRAIATEVRCGVADAVSRLISQARVLAGPAGLAYNAELSHTIADLELYALQRNLDSDTSWLGRDLVDSHV